jgi:hypothetical protein
MHSGDEKRGCKETRAREDGAQTDAGEGNGVVAFSWIMLVRINSRSEICTDQSRTPSRYA